MNKNYSQLCDQKGLAKESVNCEDWEKIWVIFMKIFVSHDITVNVIGEDSRCHFLFLVPNY